MVRGGVGLINRGTVGFALDDNLPSATQDGSSSSYEDLLSPRRARLPVDTDCNHQHVVRHTVNNVNHEEMQARGRNAVHSPSLILGNLQQL